MEVITARKAWIPSNDVDLMRKERIMLYMKLICESVGGKRTEC